jgi:hypothetical protein
MAGKSRGHRRATRSATAPLWVFWVIHAIMLAVIIWWVVGCAQAAESRSQTFYDARSIASPNLFRAPAGQLRQAGS